MPTPEALRVAIFVQPVRGWRQLERQTIERCRQRGYNIDFVLSGPGADWEQVTRLRDDGRVDKVVVPNPSHVPPMLPHWVEALDG